MKRLGLLPACLLFLACSDGGGANGGKGGHGGGQAGTTGGGGRGGAGGQGAGGSSGSAGTTGVGGATGGASGGGAGAGGQTGGASGTAGVGGAAGGGAGAGGTAGRGGAAGTAGAGGQTGGTSGGAGGSGGSGGRGGSGGTGGSGGAGGSGTTCGGIIGRQCDVGEWCDFPGDTCGAADQQGQCQPQGGTCTQQVVCGCNGKTYQSACSAHEDGVDTVNNLSCIPGNGGSGVPCGADTDCMTGYKCCATAGRAGAPIACRQGATCPALP